MKTKELLTREELEEIDKTFTMVPLTSYEKKKL